MGVCRTQEYGCSQKRQEVAAGRPLVPPRSGLGVSCSGTCHARCAPPAPPALPTAQRAPLGRERESGGGRGRAAREAALREACACRRCYHGAEFAYCCLGAAVLRPTPATHQPRPVRSPHRTALHCPIARLQLSYQSRDAAPCLFSPMHSAPAPLTPAALESQPSGNLSTLQRCNPHPKNGTTTTPTPAPPPLTSPLRLRNFLPSSPSTSPKPTWSIFTPSGM